MDKAFIEEQIKHLLNEEQIHFANWHRAQGARLAYQQMLAHIEEEVLLIPKAVQADGTSSPVPA